jgi:hypothetical protein
MPKIIRIVQVICAASRHGSGSIAKWTRGVGIPGIGFGTMLQVYCMHRGVGPTPRKPKGPYALAVLPTLRLCYDHRSGGP